MGDIANNALEGTETVGKLTFSTTAGNGEIELYTPVSFIISSLYRRDERSICHTFECLGAQSTIFTTQCEDRVVTVDGACLVGVLPVEAKMETFGHECYTSRVRVDTVDADGGITCWIPQEVDTLVRIG